MRRSSDNAFKILGFAVCFSLVVSVEANDPMDQARDAVEASLQQASQRALAAVNLDFASAISEVLNEMYNEDTQGAEDIRSKLITEQESLAQGFERIADLDAEEVARLESSTHQIYDEYKELVRRRFDSSFLLPQYRYDARKSLIMASRSLQRFEARCKVGRGTAADGIPAFQFPELPKPQYNVGFSVGNAEPNRLDASYHGTGSEAEKFRNDVNNATGVVVGMTTNIAVFGAEGAVTSFCQAAMPYAWGAGIAIVAVNMYMGHQERVEAENRIVEAQVYAFANNANDEDVARYYVEHCESLSESVKNVRMVLDEALKDSQGLERLIANVDDIDSELAEYQKIVDKREVVKKKLSDLLNQRDKDPQSVSSNEIDSVVEEYKKLGSEISEKADSKKVAAIVAKIVLTREADIVKQFGSLTWSVVDQAQERAFSSILKIVRLANNANFIRYLGEGSAIDAEIRALEEFRQARVLFKQMLAEKVKLIFGRIDRRQALQTKRALEATSKTLMENYGHASEVFNFARQVKSLVKGI